MTKKITCQVIDSTPLCEGENLLHLGWSLDSTIYQLKDLVSFAAQKPSAAFKTKPDPKAPESSLNCYI